MRKNANRDGLAVGAEVAAEGLSATESVKLRITQRVTGLLLLLLAGAAPAEATHVQPAVGHRAPDFTLRDPQGKAVQLSRVVGEKAVFLNFWATWCPPCREEMPPMERAYRDYRAEGLEILAVSIDVGEEKSAAAKVKKFMAKFKLSFPALLDHRMEVAGRYRLIGLPSTVLIDRRGVVRAVEIGYREWVSPESRQKIKDLLR